MPKVNYTNAKGLYQEPGTGLALTDGVLNYRKNVINADSTPYVLTADDVGSVVLLNMAAAQVIRLPAVADVDPGSTFLFFALTDNANGIEIKGPEGDALVYGRVAIHGVADDKCASMVSDNADDDTVVLDSTSATSGAGSIGSVVTMQAGSSSWTVYGTVVSAGSPANNTMSHTVIGQSAT